MIRSAVNVTVSSEDWHKKGLARLVRSHAQGHLPALQYWTDYKEIGHPTHQQVPYGFKYTALKRAREKGSTTLVWLDASMWAARSTDKLFEQIEADGYWFERDSKWTVGQWTSDACLKKLGMDRDEAMTVPISWAAAFGLDLNQPVGKEILDRMLHYMKDGVSFHGAWTNDGRVSKDPRCKGHRHDQSVLSILVHQMGLKQHRWPAGFQAWGQRLSSPSQCIAYHRGA